MIKEFYDKYSKDLECSCCQDLEHCINGKEPLKINCAIHYFKDKIADLEAKLAESEKLNKRLQQVIDKLRDKDFAGETLVNAVNAVYEPLYQNKYDEAEQLKQQLAEKDQAIESLQEINQSLGQTCNNDAKEIERLREQLAEKENEIEKLKIILSMQAVQVPEEQRLNLITTNCIQYNPNQTAIAVLEKVQKYIVEDAKPVIGYPYLKNSVMILNFVCDQIKSLKGDENGEN